MYRSIEQQFKKLSKATRNQIIYLTSFAFLVVFETLMALYFIPRIKDFFIFAICMYIFFYLSCYIYMVISNWKFIDKPWRKILDIDFNKSEFSKRLQQKDLVILKEILIEHKINTRNEIQELIRHYQCLLPRTIKRSGISSSIFALVISIWALLYKESIDNALFNLFLIIIVTISILLLYGLTLYMYNDLFKIFGKNALYARLESALAEIYVNFPIARRKTKPEK